MDRQAAKQLFAQYVEICHEMMYAQFPAPNFETVSEATLRIVMRDVRRVVLSYETDKCKQYVGSLCK